MSRLSGVCDLYDHISFEKMYDHGGYSTSDLLECFEIFKKKTGGVIYQHHQVKHIDRNNCEALAKVCPELEVIKTSKTVPDKRAKNGEKEIVEYQYKYYDKLYTEKEINKKTIFVTTEIRFDNLLELMPYLPYEITASCCSEGKEHIIIANESEPDREFKQHIQHGYVSDLTNHYGKALAELYLKVCERYFLYKLDERTKTIPVTFVMSANNGEEYYVYVKEPIDYMHDIEYVWPDGKPHEHWTSPKMKDEHVVILSKTDVESLQAKYLAEGSLMLKYVTKPDGGFPKEEE